MGFPPTISIYHRKGKGKKKRKETRKLVKERVAARCRAASFAGTVLTLPEILAPILNFAITKPNDKEVLTAERQGQTRVMTAQDTPWPFMLVCKTWHEIASSTPILWSAFFAIIYNGQYLDTTRLPSMLDIYLRRSKQMPLTLRIVAEYDFYGLESHEIGNIEAPFPVIHLIAGTHLHQHRWEDVHLAFNCFGGQFPLVSLFKQMRTPVNLIVDLKNTAMLKRLYINICHFPRYVDSYRLSLGQCSSLEDMRLHGDAEVLVPSAMASHHHAQVYFPNLRTLFFCLTQKQLHNQNLAFLQFSPDVVDLTLFVHYRKDTQMPPMPPPFLLPKLSCLTLCVVPAELSWKFLQSASLPSLKQLQLVETTFDNESLLGIASLLCRYPLTSLAFDIDSIAEPLSEPAFNALLSSLPKLERLTLVPSRITDDKTLEPIFRMLASILPLHAHGDNPNQPAVHILPRLEYLNLTVNAPDISVWNVLSIVMKEIVMACKQRYPANFCVSINLENMSQDAKLEEAGAQSFRRDEDIRRCTTDTFKVLLNRIDVGKSNVRRKYFVQCTRPILTLSKVTLVLRRLIVVSPGL